MIANDCRNQKCERNQFIFQKFYKNHHSLSQLLSLIITFISSPLSKQFILYICNSIDILAYFQYVIVIILHHMRTVFILIFFFYLSTIISPGSIPSVSTGVITCFTSFNSSQANASATVTVPISVSTIQSTVGLQAGVSLMSFQSIMSIQLIFNISIVSITPTSLKVTFTPINATYFKYLQLHYIAAQHSTIQILKGCFYCGNTLTGSGPRSQNFTNLTTTLSPASSLQFTSVISGVKVSNYLGTYYQFGVQAYNTGSSVVNIAVSVDEYNLLEWVCLAVIVFKRYAVTGQAYLRASSPITYTAGTSFLPAYPPLSLFANIKFFGISFVKLSMLLDQDHKFLLSTSSPAAPTSLTTNPNLLSLTLEQFFVWNASCGTVIDTTTMLCQLQCPTNYYADGLGFCVLCGNAANCLTCNAAGCLTCDNSTLFRQLNATQCPCMPSYFQSSGSCLFCNTTFPNCDRCINGTYCLVCFPPYAAFNGACLCQSGLFLVNGVCNQLMGCVQVNNITTGVYCQQCNTASNFLMALNQTCLCINFTTYNNITGKCQGVCGDGKSLDNACDDGDTNNTNGCYNNCTVNPGYYCSNPNKYAPSVCIVKMSFQAQYLYAVKDTISSSATLYFTISPDYPSLSKMDFSSLITTSIPNSAITASYSAGMLVVDIAYTETIQNTNQALNISFDKTYLYASPIQMVITPTGINYALVYNSIDSLNSIILLLSAVVGGLALLFAIVSSVGGYKLIGFEIMLPVQLMYLSLSELNHTSSAMGSLRNLSYSTGYNQITTFNLINSMNALPGLIVLQRSGQFLANINFSAVPLVIAFLLAFILRLGIKEKEKKEVVATNKKGKTKGKDAKKQQENKLDNVETNKAGSSQPKQGQEVVPVVPVVAPQTDKCQQAYVFLVDKILVVLWVALILNIIFSFEIQMLSLPTSTTFPTSLNVGAAAVFFLLAMMCIIFLACKIYDREYKITFHTKSRKYPVMLISIYTLQSIIVSSSFYDSPNSLYFGLIFSALPIMLVLKKQPHGPFFSLHNLTALFCQLLPALNMILILISTSQSQGTMASILAFVILIAALTGEGLSILRLVLVLRADYLRKKQLENMAKAEKEDVQMQSIAHETIKKSIPLGQPMFGWEGKDEEKSVKLKGSQKRLKKLDVDSEQQDDDEDEEEDELAKIKMRLKKELQSKRGLF